MECMKLVHYHWWDVNGQCYRHTYFYTDITKERLEELYLQFWKEMRKSEEYITDEYVNAINFKNWLNRTGVKVVELKPDIDIEFTPPDDREDKCLL